MMARNRRGRTETPSLRYDERIALNQWMLSLFEVRSFDRIAEHLSSLALEGLDENNVHKFLQQMKLSENQRLLRHHLALAAGSVGRLGNDQLQDPETRARSL